MSEKKMDSKKNIAIQIIRLLIVLLSIGINVVFINVIRGLYVGGAFLAFIEQLTPEYGVPGYWLSFVIVAWMWFPLFFLMIPPLNLPPMELLTIFLGLITKKTSTKRGFIRILSVLMLISMIVNVLTSVGYLIIAVITLCNPEWAEILMIKGVTTTSFIMASGLFGWVILMFIVYLILYIIDRSKTRKALYSGKNSSDTNSEKVIPNGSETETVNENAEV